MNKVIISLFFLTVFLSVSGREQLSLEGVLQKTLQNNYQISIQRLTKEEIQVSDTWGMAGRYPSLSLNGDASYALASADTLNTETTRLSGSLSAGWVLFNGFKVKYTKNNLGLNSELAGGNLAVLLETTVQSVVLAYYSIVYHQQQLELAQAALELSKSRLDAETTAREIGVGSTFDQLQAKASFLEDKANVISVRNVLNDAKRNLRYLMGDDIGNDYDVTDVLEASKQPFVLDELKSKMLSNNFNLKNQSIAIEVAKNKVMMARSDFMPKLSASGSVGLNNTEREIDDVNVSKVESVDWYAALSLSYNLFNGGRSRINHKIAQLNEEISRVRYADNEQSLTKELMSLYARYLVDLELLGVAMENEEVLALSFEIAQGLYKSGALNSIDYREVQVGYLNVQNKVLSAKLNLKEDYLSLVRITGGMLAEYNLLAN